MAYLMLYLSRLRPGLCVCFVSRFLSFPNLSLGMDSNTVHRLIPMRAAAKQKLSFAQISFTGSAT